MGKIPMQQWYPDAHIADTSMLSLEEQGAYRLLQDYMWIKAGYLNDDDKEIARLLRVRLKHWLKLKVSLAPFLLFENGRITQKRLLRDYKSACEKSQRNKLIGSMGGQKTAKNWESRKANAPAKGSYNGGAPIYELSGPKHISHGLPKLEP